MDRRILIFCYDTVVQTIRHADPLEAYTVAKEWAKLYASQGPVALFEWDGRKWEILPHQYHDSSGDIVPPGSSIPQGVS